MKLHEIIPGLYIRGAFAHIPLERKREILLSKGIKAILCTVKSKVDVELSREAWLAYHLIPLPDGKRVPIEQYDQAVDCAINYLRRQGAVLVHCVAGRNRSGLVAALVVRQLLGVSGKVACG